MGNQNALTPLQRNLRQLKHELEVARTELSEREWEVLVEIAIEWVAHQRRDLLEAAA